MSCKNMANKRIKLEFISFETIIKGNFNQFFIGDTISRGIQCTANSVVFIVFTKIIHQWKCIDIDNILVIGDFIYNISARNHNRCGRFLAADHIVENIYIPRCGSLEKDCVIKCERQNNTLGGLNFALTGKERLEKCLKNFDCCVVTCNGLSFGIKKSDNRFYLFDSHGRSATGFRDHQQPAAIIIFNSIDSLYSGIFEKSMSNRSYDITPFCIYEVSKENAAQVEKIPTSSKLKHAEDIITLANLPKKVDENIYTKYIDINKLIYLNAPVKIENINRRVKNVPVDAFPGGIIINDHLEFYVDTVLQEVYINNEFSEDSQRWFIVIWCGWPDEYATIEPKNNLEDCAALTHYLLAKDGKISGTSAGRCSTAIRSMTMKYIKTEKRQETRKWLNMNFQQLFDESEAIGNFNPHVGMIGNDRIGVFLIERDFFTKFLSMFRNNVRCGYFLSDRVWGNYFGRSMKNNAMLRFNGITTKGLCNNKKTLKSDLRKSWRDTDWNENNDKISMFLMISQIGDFEANMNAVSTISRFKTHAQLFVARESKTTGRSYFCIDPQYIAPYETSAPIAFLLQKPVLPYTNIIHMVHGTQTTSDDCFYRIFQYIDRIVAGKFNFNENYTEFKVGTKNHKQ